ncbi:MAG: hypothetical protein KDA89_23075 [Planctomycetaceae bacterium]|nr:hypothetical protein [Planctomycetaceae bacterium]
MNLAQSLHTAARQYCNEQFNYWAALYAAICRDGRDRAADRYHYTPEALDVFPRYNLLKAIRIELERIDPYELDDLTDTRELIILAGTAADDDFTREPIGKIDAAAMANEREVFCDFIREPSDSDLQSVAPLPYQRVLSQSESDSLWARFRDRWQIANGNWFPLAECTLTDVIAFQDRPFNEFASTCTLVESLTSRGVSRVWELREYGPEYELDASLFDPHYNGAEGYWSSGDLDWIVYASHEGSITIGGWLLVEIKARWPEWNQRIWTSPFF